MKLIQCLFAALLLALVPLTAIAQALSPTPASSSLASQLIEAFKNLIGSVSNP